MEFLHNNLSTFRTSVGFSRFIMSLEYVGQQLNIYGGFFLVLAGSLGNGMNILIFSSVDDYRKTPCSFFFLISSINDTIHLLINLTTRILSAGYGIDLTLSSTIWCKTRSFLITTLALISFTCSSLATIDQFLVTSRSLSLRRCSNIKWARRIIFLMIIFWSLQGIPYFLYLDISPISNTCANTNAIYRAALTVNSFVLLCGLPVIVMIVFGCLAYRNIHQTRVLVREHADRQLTKMILIQVILIIISVIPFSIVNAYAVITVGVVKDIDRQLKESLAATIVGLISYLHFAVGLFIVF
jgi:hypothetical protein